MFCLDRDIAHNPLVFKREFGRVGDHQKYFKVTHTKTRRLNEPYSHTVHK